MDLTDTKLGLQADVEVRMEGDYLLTNDSCQWLRSYGITYEILDSIATGDNDLALRVYPGSPLNADTCQCDSLIYCVTLSFPIQEVKEAGFRNENTPFQPETLVKDSFNGYVAFRDPRIGQNTNQITHTLCGEKVGDRLVYFDLWTSFPYGYNLADAVIKMEGICIVANLEDTYPGGDEMAEAGGGDEETGHND